MIVSFFNLQSFNDGHRKWVSVVAVEDASGGAETLTFVIIDQTITVTVNLASNQVETVTVTHKASGKGLVVVTAVNSPQKLAQILDVDKQPGDGGTDLPNEAPNARQPESTSAPEPAPPPAETPQFDGMIGAIRDGNEGQRAEVLEQIQRATNIDRAALSFRLRTEIRDRFGPNAETDSAPAIRNPKKIASARSWLLSCLIWTDAEDAENRQLILEHLNANLEPDATVRFWVLGQLYVCGASYALDAAQLGSHDDAGEIAALASAIQSPKSEDLFARFRSGLLANDFRSAWVVLRALRVVPIPELAADVCAQLEREIGGVLLAYDALYALSNPPMARAAASFLAQVPGIPATVQRIVRESSSSDPIAARSFAGLLAALPQSEVDRLLDEALADPASRTTAERLRGFLRERSRSNQDQVWVAGYASDTIDVGNDLLDIREDVHTLAAVMLAKEVKPPLAIGLFGDWGSGKSFFMQSIRRATEQVAADAANSPESKFCAHIVSIEFNAWHYADTNLWASMVSYILEQLAAYVAPEPTSEQRQAALVAQLGSAKAMVEEAEGEKRRTSELIVSRAAELQQAQVAREQKEIQLRDLRESDFRSLIEGNAELKKKIEGAMGTLGLPALVDSASDLARVVSEARTLRGRTAACVISVVQGKNRAALIAFMLFALVAIPGAVYLLSTRFVDVVLVRLGAIAAEVVAAIVAVKNVLQKALGQAKAGLAHIEDAKRQVDTLMAQKREEQNEREKELQKEIAALKAQEQESVSRLSAATARVAELEERIRSAKEGRSLARFLAERTRSEDYRKYLGLISTIRQDFDALGKRLTGAAGDGDQFRPVDRIVLYIDDLDRCPEDKVMEVLQAVHLLLAYPLFVVVVGVDPRWLLHSLRGTFKAFQAGDEPGISNGDVWQTTPQNYLEKIFQIPFSLRPMTQLGYATFIDALLSPKGGEAKSIAVTPQQPPQAVGQQAPVTPAEQPEPVAPPHREAEEPQPAFVIHEESLSIKAWEATFAERLFALIPTPRAAKRFSNVYRLLKAPVRRDRLPTFEGTPELMGEFQVPMLLLAILTGAPEEAGQIFPELWRMALAQGSPVDALLGSHAPFQSTEGLSILQEKIRPILSDANFPRGHKLFAEWIPRVSRFSFDVGRSVELTRYAPNVSTPA